MKSIFRPDSPLMKFMMLITNLLCLNVLWILCCIPVITAGAATTAMYSVLFRYINKQDDAVLKPFFLAFRDNFKTATLAWIPNLLIGAVLAAEVLYLSAGAQMWLKIIFGILLFIYSAASSYLYPLIARYDAPLKTSLFNSFALSFRHLLNSVCVVTLNAAPLLLLLLAPDIFWKTILLWTLGGFSVIAWLNGMMLMRIFRMYDLPAQTQ